MITFLVALKSLGYIESMPVTLYAVYVLAYVQNVCVCVCICTMYIRSCACACVNTRLFMCM